ncbi:hypothetical protein ACXZ9C_11595 [Streptococcus agalactiae]
MRAFVACVVVVGRALVAASCVVGSSLAWRRCVASRWCGVVVARRRYGRCVVRRRRRSRWSVRQS